MCPVFHLPSFQRVFIPFDRTCTLVSILKLTSREQLVEEMVDSDIKMLEENIMEGMRRSSM